MAKHSAFELEVLRNVADDHESPHTIVEDIARELKRPIAETEVLAALLALAKSGLVQAYAYDQAGRRYQPISARDARKEHEPWFMATAEGIARIQAS
jgi:hypothetical protein